VVGGSITKERSFNLNIIEDCSQVTVTVPTIDDFKNTLDSENYPVIDYKIGFRTEYTIPEFTPSD
jgi:hypothetical protein